MRTLLANVQSEPRVPNPPRRVWRDYVVVGAIAVGAILEGLLRTDVNAPYAAVPLVIVLGITLLWRRTYPFEVFVATFGAVVLFDVVGVVLGYGELDLGAAALLLVTLYSLFRWGSGREMVRGTPLVIVIGVIANVADYNGVGDVIGGFVVLALAVAIALVVRYRERFQQQSREQVRVQERERLARELHDTVAHHMSAIAIQAQAGRFVAQNGSLEGAAEALEIIEEEASRALSETRSIVGALRDSEAPVAMTPQHGMADIKALTSAIGSPVVTVDLAESAQGVTGGVGAAAFRIAQESITNARRHARNATSVHVQVAGSTDAIHLTITDDGDPPSLASQQGFGLIGMTERATLLGGSLAAGPGDGRGWVVQATLPRQNGS